MAANEKDVNTVEAKAVARHVRVTPMKARRVIDLIRGKNATDAVADGEPVQHRQTVEPVVEATGLGQRPLGGPVAHQCTTDPRRDDAVHVELHVGFSELVAEARLQC